MNKYAELLAKQNPVMEQECLGCTHKNKLKTKEVFKSKEYSFVCSKCGATNTIKDIPEMIKKLEKDFRKMGITVK